MNYINNRNSGLWIVKCPAGWLAACRQLEDALQSPTFYTQSLWDRVACGTVWETGSVEVELLHGGRRRLNAGMISRSKRQERKGWQRGGQRWLGKQSMLLKGQFKENLEITHRRIEK